MSHEETLKQELYSWAAALPRSGWYTERYRDFERMLSARDLTALRSLRCSIEANWDRYYNQPIAPEERTAESVVGHRLLVEGLAHWMKALKLADAGAEPAECLPVAEAGNRLLLAVQLHSRRVSAAIQAK